MGEEGGGVSGWLGGFGGPWLLRAFVLKYQRFRFATMPSILVIVFFLQLAIHLVNTVGAQAINDLVIPPTNLLSDSASSQIY